MHKLAAAAVNRIMNWLSPSQAALRNFLHALAAVHLALYRASGGRLTTSLGLPSAGMILLTTTGRKTGQPRTVPLLSIRRDGDWLIIASNAGLDRPPAWWFNLRANAAATVQAGRQAVPVTAAVADDAARAELWPLFVREYAGYSDHQRRTSRELPIVILHPAALGDRAPGQARVKPRGTWRGTWSG